jgi:hypothetical protein
MSFVVFVSREASELSLALLATPWTFPALRQITVLLNVMALEVSCVQIALARAVWHQTRIRSNLRMNLWSARVSGGSRRQWQHYIHKGGAVEGFGWTIWQYSDIGSLA